MSTIPLLSVRVENNLTWSATAETCPVCLEDKEVWKHNPLHPTSCDTCWNTLIKTLPVKCPSCQLVITHVNGELIPQPAHLLDRPHTETRVRIERNTTMLVSGMLIGAQLLGCLFGSVMLGTNRSSSRAMVLNGALILTLRTLHFHSDSPRQDCGPICLKLATTCAMIGGGVISSAPLIGVATAAAGLIALKDLRTLYHRWRENP
jgi:hypothetical protein